MDEQSVGGCERCREWVTSFGDGEMRKVADVARRFERKASYFDAELLQCPSCETSWLSAYYEDFTNTPIDEEWGDRSWIRRPLTDQQLGVLRSRSGKKLDIDAFAAD